MEPIINDYLLKLEFGELLQFENMAVLPIFSSIDDSPGYMILQDALERKLLTITEVSESGSVPELKVTNRADCGVLILDGEELVGAKQNRILNTTILLKKDSETVIPVSCVEQGRWTYVSNEFTHSDSFMPADLRAIKYKSVACSLAGSGKYAADQHAIWNGVFNLANEADAHSPTHSMKHVFDMRKKQLDKYLEVFRYQPHQKGILVFINGDIVGLDLVPQESAQEKMHPKLIKSYAMNALFGRERSEGNPCLEKAEAFVNTLRTLEEKHYKSLGQGMDYRYSGRSIVGSALVFQKKVVHASFFRSVEDDKKSKVFYRNFQL
jgi:hypothetical protein